MRAELKRQNFNTTPEQEAEIAWLKEAVGASTTKDALLWAVRIVAALARASRDGQSVYLIDRSGRTERLLIPELEQKRREEWVYLVRRPHPWRRQMYVKGRRLMASTVWLDMIANGMSAEQVARDWDLPTEAVEEIVRYCEESRELIEMEASEEQQQLTERGAA